MCPPKIPHWLLPACGPITPSVSRTPVYSFTCLLYLPVLVLVRVGWGFLDGFTCNAGDVRDVVSIPGSGKTSGGGASILA